MILHYFIFSNSEVLFSSGAKKIKHNACSSSPCGDAKNTSCFNHATDPDDYICQCLNGAMSKSCNSTSVIHDVKMDCRCSNGSPVRNSLCPRKNAHYCTKCNKNYYLVDKYDKSSNQTNRRCVLISEMCDPGFHVDFDYSRVGQHFIFYINQKHYFCHTLRVLLELFIY